MLVAFVYLPLSTLYNIQYDRMYIILTSTDIFFHKTNFILSSGISGTLYIYIQKNSYLMIKYETNEPSIGRGNIA